MNVATNTFVSASRGYTSGMWPGDSSGSLSSGCGSASLLLFPYRSTFAISSGQIAPAIPSCSSKKSAMRHQYSAGGGGGGRRCTHSRWKPLRKNRSLQAKSFVVYMLPKRSSICALKTFRSRTPTDRARKSVQPNERMPDQTARRSRHADGTAVAVAVTVASAAWSCRSRRCRGC